MTPHPPTPTPSPRIPDTRYGPRRRRLPLGAPACSPPHASPLPRAVTPRAFTLLENMIAMLIFSLGLITIAGIFPSAILLQKRTIDAVAAKDAVQQVNTLVAAIPILDVDVEPAVAGGLAVQAVAPAPNLTSVASLASDITTRPWDIGARSLPTMTSDPTQRDFYWVPFARRTSATAASSDDYQLFVFVLQRFDNAEYLRPTAGPDAADWADPTAATTIPSVKKQAVTRIDGTTFGITGGFADNEFNVDDQILDEYGQIYTIAEVPDLSSIRVSRSITPDTATAVNPAYIWYAPPPEERALGSSVHQIRFIVDEDPNDGFFP